MNYKLELRYQEITKRLKELDRILGWSRDEKGISLRSRSLKDPFANIRYESIRRTHQVDWEEHMTLTAEAIHLEDSLEITEQYMEFLNELDIPDIDIF